MTPSWDTMYPYYMGLPMHPDGDFFSCGVRLSMALHHAGAFNKSGYAKGGKKVSKHGWAMVAEQLYGWLRLHELGAAQQLDASGALPTENGVVYLRNCFTRSYDPSDEARTGDHIDLYVSGKGLLSAIRWPTEFPGGPFALMSSPRDGKVRFWPTP